MYPERNVKSKKEWDQSWGRCVLVAGLLVALMCPFTIQADNRYTWHPLFGKNLSQADYAPEAWIQKGNIITSVPEECIWTLKEYDNFELDMEFNASEGAVGNLILFCADRDNWPTRSIRVRLADIDGIDSVTGEAAVCGSISGYGVAARDGIVKDPGEWNHLRVRAVNGRISVIMNGHRVTEWNMRADLPHPPGKGFIGLEGTAEEAPFKYRNIKIRIIKESETKTVTNKRKREPRNFPVY